MKTKIDVFQQKDKPIHRWNVYNTFSESKDKYNLYFKNRYNTKHGWEVYDETEQVSEDHVLYKHFEQTTGIQNSKWKTAFPDAVRYDEYYRGFNELGVDVPEDHYPYIGKKLQTISTNFISPTVEVKKATAAFAELDTDFTIGIGGLDNHHYIDGSNEVYENIPIYNKCNKKDGTYTYNKRRYTKIWSAVFDNNFDTALNKCNFSICFGELDSKYTNPENAGSVTLPASALENEFRSHIKSTEVSFYLVDIEGEDSRQFVMTSVKYNLDVDHFYIRVRAVMPEIHSDYDYLKSEEIYYRVNQNYIYRDLTDLYFNRRPTDSESPYQMPWMSINGYYDSNNTWFYYNDDFIAENNLSAYQSRFTKWIKPAQDAEWIELDYFDDLVKKESLMARGQEIGTKDNPLYYWSTTAVTPNPDNIDMVFTTDQKEDTNGNLYAGSAVIYPIYLYENLYRNISIKFLFGNSLYNISFTLNFNTEDVFLKTTPEIKYLVDWENECATTCWAGRIRKRPSGTYTSSIVATGCKPVSATTSATLSQFTNDSVIHNFTENPKVGLDTLLTTMANKSKMKVDEDGYFDLWGPQRCKWFMENETYSEFNNAGGEFFSCDLILKMRNEDSDVWTPVSYDYGNFSSTLHIGLTFWKDSIRWLASIVDDSSYNDGRFREFHDISIGNNDFLTVSPQSVCFTRYHLTYKYNSIEDTIDVYATIYGGLYDDYQHRAYNYTTTGIVSGKLLTLKKPLSIQTSTDSIEWGNSYHFLNDYAWKVANITLVEASIETTDGWYTFPNAFNAWSMDFTIKPINYVDVELNERTDDYQLPNVLYPADLENKTNETFIPTDCLYYRSKPRESTITYQWPTEVYKGINDGIVLTHKTITDTVENFHLLSSGYINGDILEIGGAIDCQYIDVDSIRYAFSYPTQKYFPYRTLYDWPITQSYQNGFHAYVDYDTLQEMYANWYTDNNWKPQTVYKIEKTTQDNIFTYTAQTPTDNHNWHIMGISPLYMLYKETLTQCRQIYEITDETKGDVLYPLVFELSDTVPAYTFDLLDVNERVWISIYPPFVEPNVDDIYITNQQYRVIKPSESVKEWKYATAAEYAEADDERWLTEIVYNIPAGSYVPTKHWPQMVYETKRYDDVNIITDNEMVYPKFGFYPPTVEVEPTQWPQNVDKNMNFYRYVGDVYEFYSTVKAGSIYLPIGTDIESELLLSSYDTPLENNHIETNPYGYEYVGTEDYTYKNILHHLVSSEDFGAYPKDGIYNDGYWYEYVGTNEEVEYSWGDLELRGNATYNIDMNSPQDFAIGDVAGASFTVDIQGNIRDNIKYLGRKCKLYYDFENKAKYQDFGIYTIDDVKFMNHQVSTITAYDNIKKFDVPVFEYLTSEQVSALFPMTAKTLFQLMCEYCEVPYYTSMEFLNSDKLCYGTFGDANLTARQVISYIAEIAAGYVICDQNGFAVIKTFKPYQSISNQQIIYDTRYENIISLLNSTEQDRAKIKRNEYKISQQVNQQMDLFPTEVIDSIVFNNIDTNSFINYREELNAIYDMSDNPFVNFLTAQTAADELTNGILDQIAILIPPIYDGDAKFYAGTIELKNFDLSTIGYKQVVDLLDKVKEKDYFIPTTISINTSGITLTAKGQPKYSTSIVNSELAKQVNSLKMSVKEVKLSIPEALNQTLENHTEDITSLQTNLSTVETDVSTLQTNLSTVQGNLSTVESTLAAQEAATTQQFTNVNARDDGQDARLDAIEAWDAATTTALNNIGTSISDLTTATTSLETTVGVHSTSISNIETNYATKTYAEGLNQIETITNGWKLKIGEDEVSFYTDNGYLFIFDGTTTWKLHLEVNA